MGLVRYQGDWDPEWYADEYRYYGDEPPEDEMADVRRWAAVREKAKKRGLTDDEYERFVPAMADFGNRRVRALETGDMSGLERKDVSRGALLRGVRTPSMIAAAPFAVGSGVLALKGHPKAALGALAAGAATGGLFGKLNYDAEKARRNEYNSIVDKLRS